MFLKLLEDQFLAKIAATSELVKSVTGSGEREPPEARLLASGDGWTVSDVICNAGPAHRPFEERHSGVSIGVVVSGTFQYRSSAGRVLMTPGSLLLGNPLESFCCSHEHSTGDRCVAFSYAPEFFERLAREAEAPISRLSVGRLPPIRALSPLVAKVSGLLADGPTPGWDHLSIQLAARTVRLVHGVSPGATSAPPGALARVTRIVRMIHNETDLDVSVASLARLARLSPYHFLRTFEALTGTTPHQYVLRTRLRLAACRLRSEGTKIVDIALECGFNDVTNFNRMFRTEFGMPPRVYRSAG